MTRDRWREAESIFQEALEVDGDDRERLLRDRCGEDGELRDEVDELLAHHRAADGDFLEGAVFEAPVDVPSLPLTVGDYRVIRAIGEGGMGLVYEAEQQHPHRRIALKLLRPGLYGEAQVKRFRLECDVLGQLDHPGIARVYDAGQALVSFTTGPTIELPYLAMELVRGRNLTEHLEQSALDPHERLDIFVEICSAVHHAHQQAVIHRDLKPGNILVDEAGQPKVLDFGLARVADGQRHTRYTRTGDLIGTLQYMSPEQLRGDRELVDLRSDVFSLGVILHQMLTGTLPYGSSRPSISEILLWHERERAVGLAKEHPALRGGLESIIRMALAPRPSERYPTAGALGDDVRRFLRGEALLAHTDSGWDSLRRFVRLHRVAVLVSATILTLVLASSVLAWTLYSRAERERRNATERLWESNLAAATAERAANRFGRRVNSLEYLREAARIRPSREVRDGMVASYALTDFALENTMPLAPDARASAQGLRRLDRVAIKSSDGRVEIRSVPGLEKMTELQGPPYLAHVAAFSPEGRYFAGKFHPDFFDQEEVRFWIWDLQSKRTVLRLERGEMVGGALAFGSSASVASWVAVGQSDGYVHLYALSTGSEWKRLDPEVGTLTLSAGPTGLLAAATRERIYLWDPESGRLIDRQDAPLQISSICWMGPETLLIASLDHNAYLWDISRSELRRSFAGHEGVVAHVAANEDASLVATDSWDTTLRIWNARSGKEIIAPLQRGQLVGFVDRLLVQQATTMSVFETVIGKEVRAIHADVPFIAPSWIDSFAEAEYVVTTSLNAGLQIWHRESGKMLLAVDHPNYRWGSILETNGNQLVGYGENQLTVWPLELSPTQARLGGGRVLWEREGTSFGTPVLDPTGSRIILSSPDGIVGIDLRTGERVFELPAHPGIASLAISPDGRLLFAGIWREGDAVVWDLHTSEIVARFQGDSIAGDFGLAGDVLLVSNEWWLECYETVDWSRRYQIRAGRDRTGSRPAISPDGCTVAMASAYDVELYSIADGERLVTLSPPARDAVNAVCFTKSGNEVFALLRDQMILSWDLGRIRERLRPWNLDW